MRPVQLAFALLAVLMLSAPSAMALQTEGSGSVTIVDPTFGAYTATKHFWVYADDDADNPMPVAGHFTYIYTLTNDPGSFVSLKGLKVLVPNGAASQFGFLPGSGVAPSSTQIVDQNDPNSGVSKDEVQWDFVSPLIAPGAVSEKLYVISPYGPGDVDVTVNGDFSLDADANCIGPVVEPAAVACTIGFWKNREKGKKGLLKFFPGSDFDDVKAEAVAISGGVFADEAALVSALTSKGNRPIEVKAKQQTAALLLTLAAGNLFPGNTKCRLFSGTQLDLDGDGQADSDIDSAVTQIISDILSGDPSLQADAKDLTDDINNGIGVIGATQFN